VDVRHREPGQAGSRPWRFTRMPSTRRRSAAAARRSRSRGWRTRTRCSYCSLRVVGQPPRLKDRAGRVDQPGRQGEAGQPGQRPAAADDRGPCWPRWRRRSSPWRPKPVPRRVRRAGWCAVRMWCRRRRPLPTARRCARRARPPVADGDQRVRSFRRFAGRPVTSCTRIRQPVAAAGPRPDVAAELTRTPLLVWAAIRVADRSAAQAFASRPGRAEPLGAG